MRKRSLAILLLIIALPLAAKDKSKHKVKYFVPVPMHSLAEAAGTYVGIDDYYVVTITAAGGTVRHEDQTGTLRDVQLRGADLTATVVFPDGSRETLRATFCNRVLNSETAFGLVINEPAIDFDGNHFTQLFCRRR